MSYRNTENLYKDQTILMFKECFCLEKINGTSAHITWHYDTEKIHFQSGSAKHNNFLSLFDESFLRTKFKEIFPASNCTIFGEAYAGKIAGMSKTYGDKLKFIVFEVKVDDNWLSVPNAHDVSIKMGLEFVYYAQVPATIEDIDRECHKDSEQAIRNGMGTGHIREGVVIRPLVEVRLNNDERIIVKHKRKEFRETKTPRVISEADLEVLKDARKIADEWVTEMRLTHVLDKFPEAKINDLPDVIQSMLEDIRREAKGEIIFSKEASRQIGRTTALMFKNRLTKQCHSNI